jgi:hypothetical protein
MTAIKTRAPANYESNFVTANGSALTVAYVNGAWREKSRIA